MPEATLPDLKTASQQVLAALSFAGQIALHQNKMPPHQGEVKGTTTTTSDAWQNAVSEEEYREIINKMVGYVHLPAGHLPKADELYLEQQLADVLGFDVAAELEQHRLNHSMGIMGSEQHLKRSPTDELSQHDQYQEAGIAANRGAFGWFTENGVLTPEGVAREKYYFAVQLMYLPDWNTQHDELKPWYKFRKMVMVNPAEEIAVVGVVADAGPAMWVQKQFGGSPEVIREGKVWSPKSQGHVLLYFVDDPENKIPLGPIHLNQQFKASASGEISSAAPHSDSAAAATLSAMLAASASAQPAEAIGSMPTPEPGPTP